MMKFSILLSLAVITFVSCQSTTECCGYPEEGGEQVLYGKYRIYETGYSPGAGYVTEPVPADPVRYMDFQVGNRFSSNYSGFEEYEYYLISADTLTGDPVLSFYKYLPLDKPAGASYSIAFDSASVKLHYRFCIEGCHIGLKKMEGSSE